MKKTGKWVILCLALLAAACCANAPAARADVYENISYHEKRGNHVVIDDVYKCGEIMFIPQYINGKTVIGWRLTEKYKKVKHLILPRYFKVESVYFYYYSSNNPLSFFPNLESLEFSSESKYLKLYGGGLYSADLKKLYAVLPYARELLLPEETEEIMKDALDTGNKIEKIQVAAGNKHYCARKNALYTKDMKELYWAAPKRKEKEFRVPAGVQKIRSYAFYKNMQMTKVYLPDNLDIIGGSAFSSCKNLKRVRFGKNLREIASYAFETCSSLREIILPEGLDVIHSDAFEKCTAVEKISIPRSFWGYSGSLRWYIRNQAKRVPEFTVYAGEGTEVYEQIKSLEKVKVNLKPLKGGKEIPEGEAFRCPTDSSWYRSGAKTLYISSAAQFASFLKRGNEVMQGEEYVDSGDTYYKKKIILTRDIDMKGYAGLRGVEYFEGEFDGRGHTIKNLNIYTPSYDCVGVFNILDGTVKNLRVKGRVTGSANVGGIVGAVDGNATIKNCHFYGTVRGKDAVAGILGSSEDGWSVIVTNCVNHGKVIGNYFVAGIVAQACDISFPQFYKNRNKGKLSAIRYKMDLYDIYDGISDDDWYDWDDEW